MLQSRAGRIAFLAAAVVLLVIIARNLYLQSPLGSQTGSATSGPALPVLRPSPLSAAVMSGNVVAVQDLLKQGADINDRDNTTVTALEAAAASGNVQVSRLLLAHGADPNIYRYNPVLYNAVRNMPVLVPELLSHGVDVNE